RRELLAHLGQRAGVAVVVTHDPVEAALATTVAVMGDGTVVQSGSLADIAARPRSPFAADLAGVNLLAGRARGTSVTLAGGAVLTSAAPAAGDVWVVVHPRAVALHRRQPEGTPRNVWPSTVAGIDRAGDRVRARLAAPVPLVAEITPAATTELGLTEGAPVWVSVKATELTVLPA
ncbi:MAG: TOBE domain-containing protein, partial [Acidimicrobiales bacterium]